MAITAQLERTTELRCPKCCKVKLVKSFSAERADGSRHAWCIACQSGHSKERYDADPEYFKRRVEARYWAVQKNRFGVDRQRYEELLAAQGGVCAICKGPELQRRRFCIDHDHATGALRGLLCTNCNAGLGQFRDNPTVMATAIEYLTRGRA